MITINNISNIFWNKKTQEWLSLYLKTTQNKWFIIEDLDDINFIERNLELLNNNINFTNFNLWIWTYYNLIWNIEIIINLEKIIKIIDKFNINQITFQVPFIKESLISAIKENKSLMSNINNFLDKINEKKISIEFVLNNFLDIYSIKSFLYNFDLDYNLEIKISIWPQFLFINYDPLNLRKKEDKEIEIFFLNSKKILLEFQKSFWIRIYQTYFYLGHIAYFYWINYLTNENIFDFIKKWKNKTWFKGNLLFNKTIFSITDRLYSYFIQESKNNTDLSWSRISNKKIFQWIINNISSIQKLEWQFNYNIFKWFDDGNLSKIVSYYKNTYEYYVINL